MMILKQKSKVLAVLSALLDVYICLQLIQIVRLVEKKRRALAHLNLVLIQSKQNIHWL